MDLRWIDEATDLLGLYDLDYMKCNLQNPEDPAISGFRDQLHSHYKKFGRIGFFPSDGNPHGNADTSAQSLFSSMYYSSPSERKAEKSFYQTLLSQDLDKIIEQGHSLARRIIPDGDYKDPIAVLLLNGHISDAMVLSPCVYGINLNVIYQEVKELAPGRQIKEAMDRISSCAAHEGNHGYVGQLQLPADHWLLHAAFGEGLATYAETMHLPWHVAYAAEADYWIDYARKAISATDASERICTLSSFRDSSTLNKYRPDAIETIEKVLSTPQTLDDQLYQAILNDIFVKANGPIYHAGYHMWQTIEDNLGLATLKSIVKQGPAFYFDAYDSLK